MKLHKFTVFIEDPDNPEAGEWIYHSLATSTVHAICQIRMKFEREQETLSSKVVCVFKGHLKDLTDNWWINEIGEKHGNYKQGL